VDPVLIIMLAVSVIANVIMLPLALRGTKRVRPLVLQIAALEKVQTELGHQIERKWGPKKSKRIAGATLLAVKAAPVGRL
jgi:hypothetical protein